MTFFGLTSFEVLRELFGDTANIIYEFYIDLSRRDIWRDIHKKMYHDTLESIKNSHYITLESLHCELFPLKKTYSYQTHPYGYRDYFITYDMRDLDYAQYAKFWAYNNSTYSLPYIPRYGFIVKIPSKRGKLALDCRRFIDYQYEYVLPRSKIPKIPKNKTAGCRSNYRRKLINSQLFQ